MPKDKEQWTITLGGERGWGGLVPAYMANVYPYIGRKNQAALTTDINITDPNILTQGLAPTVMTYGNEAQAVTETVTAIMNTAVADGETYAVGGKLLHKIQTGGQAVAIAGGFPHTIDGTGAETAHDVLHYKGELLYSYEDAALGGAGAKGGNIGMYDLSSTFDPDWWTAVLGGDILQNSIHYMILGGDDKVYITNGRYMARLDGTTDTAQALDFWEDSETVSHTWNNNRLKIAVNRPNITDLNVNQSGIYTWNGTASSWEGDPIEVDGKIGAIYTQNGITYVWWDDSSAGGGYGHQFGYIDGLQLKPLRRFNGNLPNQKQITTYRGYIAWIESSSAAATTGQVYLWGSRDIGFPPELFRYGTSDNAVANNTIGAMAAPFGEIMIGSHDTSTGYDLSLLNTNSVKSVYKTRSFPVSGADYTSQIDLIMVEHETLATGAKCDFTLKYNNGASSLSLDQIAYASGGPTRVKILNRGPSDVQDFRLDISWANGSATNLFKIRSIFIQGHYKLNN